MEFEQVLQQTWPGRVNARDRLIWRGRHLNTVFLLGIGDRHYVVKIEQGRLGPVRRGPFVMEDWSFALRASPQAWAEFCMPLPRPGFHDLMAMLKLRHLVIEGDLYPLMSNLLYFKEVLALLRQDSAAS